MSFLNQESKTVDLHKNKIALSGTHSEYQKGKILFDFSISLIITIFILTWLFPVVGALILVDSPGPILHIQRRIDNRGNWFYCLKFRTMIYKTQENYNYISKNGSRMTAVGRFLHETGIDKIPQFLNVLAGYMSIIGPRSHTLQYSELYSNTIPNYEKRYHVKPGIVGLAQIKGHYGETDQLIKMHHQIKYDIFYEKKQSFSFDIWICISTLAFMLKKIANTCQINN